MKKIFSAFIIVCATFLYAFAQPEGISNLTALPSLVEGSVVLEWTSPESADGMPGPFQYLVKYASSEINSSDFYDMWISTYLQNWTLLAAAGLYESRILTGLTPGATLYFAIVAVDTDTVYGVWSSSSDSGGLANSESFAIVPDSVPDQVSGVVLGNGDNNIDVSWTANSESDINHYSLERSSYSSGEGFSGIVDILSPGTTHQDTALLNGNTYYYRVRAVDNTVNTGEYSTVSGTRPWVNVPSPVLSADPVAVSTSSLSWAWNLSANAQGYRVINSSSGTNLSGDLAPGDTYWIQSSLTPNTSSSIFVQAFNDLISVDSLQDTVFTWANTPSGVTSVEMTSQIDLSWSSNGNSPSTRYRVRRSTNDFTDFITCMDLAVSTTHQDTGLIEGATYYKYKVWAYNGDDILSPWVQYSTSVLNIPPSPPLISIVVPGTNDGEVSITWVASGDDGLTGMCSSYLIKWATFTVTESNFNGIITSSSVVATIEYPISEDPKVLTNLNPGTTYCFAIRAMDEVGNYSLISNTKTVVSTDNLPQVPTSIVALAVSSSTINVSWALPGYVGFDDRDRYKIYRATFSFAAFQANVSTFTVLHPATYFIDTGLTAETTYYYRVSTLDKGDQGNGYFSLVLESTLSGPVVFTRTPDTVSPASIQSITALTGDVEGKVNLSWTSTGDDGAVGSITGGKFRIDWDTNAGKVFSTSTFKVDIPTNTSPGTQNIIQVTELSAGATYYFRIWTSDEADNYSSISSGATAFAQLDVTKPSAITDLSSTAVWRKANLSWTAPGDDGVTSPLNGTYEIRTSTEGPIDDDTKWNNVSSGYPYRLSISTSTAPGALETVTITGLDNGTTYYFSVRSTDESNNQSDLAVISSSALPVNNFPSTFDLLLPGNDSISSTNKPTFTWESAADADIAYGDSLTYTIYYSTDNTFEVTVTTIVTGITGTSHTAAYALMEDKPTYWKVRAIDKEGAIIPSFNIYRVKINSVNSAPLPFSLIGFSTGTVINTSTYLLAWNASSDNDPGDTLTYRAEYSLYEDFSVIISSSGLPSENFTTASLVENATYWWRVWANDGLLETLCSANLFFMVNAVPEKPLSFNLSGPVDNDISTSTSVDFSWETTSDPDPLETVTYNISWSLSSNFASSTTVTGLTQPSTNIPGFTENELYYWCVTAIGSDNQTILSNQVRRLYIDVVKELPGNFDLIEPGYGAVISTTTMPLFSWSKADDPDKADDVRYIIDISPNPDFTGLGSIAVDRGADRYYVPLIGLADQTTYFWRVRASGYQGNPIPVQVDPGFTYSSTGTLIISMTNNAPQAFTLLSPGNNVTVDSKKPKLKWSIAKDSDVGAWVKYTVIISSSPGFETLIESAQTGALEYEPINNLTENRKYYWKVSAVDNGGLLTNSESNFYFFVPILNVPQSPTGFSGVQSDDKMQFTIKWSPVMANSDSSVIDDLKGYNIYRGLSDQRLAFYAVVPNTVTEWCDENTDGGNIFYQIRSVDTSGIENIIDDSPVLSSHSGSMLKLLSEDNSLNVEIPASVSQILLARNNKLNKDLRFAFTHNATKENNMTILSYEIKLIAPEGSVAEDISLPQPLVLKFSYGAGTAASARLAMSSIASSQLNHFNIFWNNGLEYIRLGGTSDPLENSITARIIKTGEYQLRRVNSAATFRVASIYPPKVFTPGNPPYENIMFYVDNPEADKVVGKVYDLNGEFVANLNPLSDATSSNVVLEWNGTTAQGSLASKGIYIYQFEGSGRVINGTIVVAR